MNPSHRFIGLTLVVGLLSAHLGFAQDNIILKNGAEIQAKVLEVSPGQIKYRRQDNPDGPVYTTGTGDVLLIKYANGTKDVLGKSAPGMSTGPMNPELAKMAAPAGNAAPGRLGYHTGLFSRYFTDDTGGRINNSVVRSRVADQPDAMRAYRQGKSLRRWTYVTAGTGIALIGAGAVVATLGDGGFEGRADNRWERATSTADTDGRTGSDHRGDHGSAKVGVALAGGGVLLGVAALILDHRATVRFRRAADRYNQHLQPGTSLRFGPSQRGLGIGMAYTF